jgi:hypothetical protein
MLNSFVFGRRSTLNISFAIGLSVIVAFAFVPAVAVLVISFTNVRALPLLPVDWVGSRTTSRSFRQRISDTT